MDISINAKVKCSDGPCGESTRVVLNPTTEEITHLVVSDDSMLQETERLVSVNHIVESTPQKIQLNLSKDEMEEMPVYSTVQVVPSNLSGYTGVPYMMWPYYPAAIPPALPEEEHIPADELTIRRGATVEAADGFVGRVDEFLVNPENGRISHLVLREGHLWGKKDVTIPVNEIDRFGDNTVTLKMNKAEIEKLPTVPRKDRMG